MVEHQTLRELHDLLSKKWLTLTNNGEDTYPEDEALAESIWSIEDHLGKIEQLIKYVPRDLK
jgi:hypothetical protein